MTIDEAMAIISLEYDDDVGRAKSDPAFESLMSKCIGAEYDEIDRELPGYVHDIALVSGVPVGTTLPGWTYQMARMCFRLGMRTQRKLDAPDKPSSMFWRSDGTAQ